MSFHCGKQLIWQEFELGQGNWVQPFKPERFEGFFFGKEDGMRSRKSFVVFIILLLTLFIGQGSLAGDSENKKPQKIGILLVTFGSSLPDAQVSFENIDRKVKAAFPGLPVRWAYTSSMIRKKLARQGKNLDSPREALTKMTEEGFTHVAVQSLHTIGGKEYNEVLRIVRKFQDSGGFESIRVGNPLLYTQEDLGKMTKALLENIPKERTKDDGVVFMGHGTHQPSNAFYAALMFRIQRRDPNVFIGCVEGYPEIDDIKEMLLEKKIKKAYLMPLMSVAGDHARNDMAGEDKESWVSILTKIGIECIPILKGTAEYDYVVEIWVDHLREVLAHFRS
jgi:sirohydrochlorin cobaltochelatase